MMALDAPAPDTPQLTAASSSSSSSPSEPRSEPDTTAMDLDDDAEQQQPRQQQGSSTSQMSSKAVASPPSTTLIIKRKVAPESKANGPSKKKAKTSEPSNGLVELKNGKLIYKPRALGLEHQLAALKQRMELQEHLQGQSEPLKEVPEQYHSALAKIVHESEKTLNELAKHAKSMLLPSVASVATLEGDEDGSESSDKKKPVDLLSLEVLKKAINAIAKRVNWGVEDPASVNLVSLDQKAANYHLPAGLCLWRWEVTDRTLVVDGLPVELANKVEERYAERQKVQTRALELLKALPESDRAALFDKTVKSKKISSSAAAAVSAGKAPMELDGSDNDSASKPEVVTQSKKGSKAKEPDPEKEKAKAERAAEKQRKEAEKVAKAEERASKAAEKAAQKAEKDKAKALKDAAKAEQEAAVQSKTQSLQKQAGAFMGFFKAAPEVPTRTSSPARPSPGTRDNSEEPRTTDFERAFKGFHCTKDVSCMYPKDYIKPASKLSNEQLINSGATLTCSSVISDIVNQCKRRDVPKYKPRPLVGNIVSVKSIMQNISEGDLTSSNSASYWRQALCDRKKVPVKLLSFGATDRRPGYIGTWSKKSRLIRPRNPFAQDSSMFTYDYDSEDEWEEEDQNGDDVNSDDARSLNSGSEAEDSDEDGWLCEDDEVEFEEGFEGDSTEHQRDPEMAARNRAMAKRERSNKDAAARSKAPKALVPVSRGPVWEPQYGQPLHSTFESMTISFLNDAKPGLNPMTFVTKPAFTQAGAAQASKTSEESAPGTDPLSPQDAKRPVASGSGALKAPKKPFPKELYTAFVTAVTHSDASSKSELVVELSKKFPGATKVAIEAELKEHVKKSKTGGMVSWTASDELKAKAAGGA